MKLAKTDAMINAAAVVIRALDPSAERTALGGLLAGVVVLLHVADEEHLVVHREPKSPCEHHQRDVAGDRHRAVGRVDAEQRDAPAPLERGGEHPKAAAADNGLVTAAWSGTSSERKAIISSTKPRRITVPITSSSRAEISDARSTYDAV